MKNPINVTEIYKSDCFPLVTSEIYIYIYILLRERENFDSIFKFLTFQNNIGVWPCG